MLKLKQTWNRIRHRPEGASKLDSSARKRKLPKLKMKFLDKFKRQKRPAAQSIDHLPPQTNGSAVELRASVSEDNILRKQENDIPNKEQAKETDKAGTCNETENLVTINVECYDDQSHSKDDQSIGRSLERLTENRVSKSSLGTGVSMSRASMISQKSMSNISMSSYKRGPETRTVWTQTELVEKLSKTCSTEDLDTKAKSSSTDTQTDVSSLTSLSRSVTSQINIEGMQITPWASAEFGIDDVFSREPVINPKLAAMRDRIVHRLTYPNIDHSDPEVCVNLLRYHKIPYLIKLNRKISNEEGTFNEEFIAFRGLDILIELMEVTACSGMTSLIDTIKMLQISECATSLVNSSTGRDFIISHGEHVVSLARGMLVNG